MKSFFFYLMVSLYIAAGLTHFFKPGMYKKIIPRGIPAPMFLVYFTGVLEIVLAFLLLFSNTRNFAAWGIIILLIAVFPANIQMAINYWKANSPYLWITMLRLPLQAVLIWWAWLYTK